MAIILPGPAVSSISGSIGGITFQRSRSGLIARTKNRVRKTATPTQLERRMAVQRAKDAWNSLTVAERAAWTTALTAIQQPTNAFGTQRNWTAKQFMMHLCSYPPVVNFPKFTAPTFLYVVFPITSLSATLSFAGTYTLNFNGVSTSFVGRGILLAHRYFRADPPFTYRTWKQISVRRWFDNAPYDFKTDFLARWGEPQIGETIALRYQPLYQGSSLPDKVWTFSTTVVA